MPELVKLKNERDVKLAEVVGPASLGGNLVGRLAEPRVFREALGRRRSKLWQRSRRPGRPFEKNTY